MIYGIGVDCTTIERFNEWPSYSHEKLLKVFTRSELQEGFDSDKTAHLPTFFASRFAVKEAFYKALSNLLLHHHNPFKPISFATCRQAVEVAKNNLGIPQLIINWKTIEKECGVSLPALFSHLSLSHEKNMAVAFVILEKQI